MPNAAAVDSSRSEMTPSPKHSAGKSRTTNYFAGLLICLLIVVVILLRGSLTRQCSKLHGLAPKLRASLLDGRPDTDITLFQAGASIDVSYRVVKSRAKRDVNDAESETVDDAKSSLEHDGLEREKRDVIDDTNSTLMSSLGADEDVTVAPPIPDVTVTPMAEPEQPFIPATPTEDGDTTLAYAGVSGEDDDDVGLGVSVGLPIAIFLLLVLILIAILLIYRYRPQKFNNLKFIPIKRKGMYDFNDGIVRQTSAPPEIIHTVDIGRRGSEYVLNLVPEGLMYKALYEFKAEDENQLTLQPEMEVEVLEKTSTGWWKGCTSDESGWFPSSYVEPVKKGAANMGYTPDQGVPRAARSMSMERPNSAEIAIESEGEEPATLANVDQKDLSRVLATLRLQSLREIGVSPDILQKTYRVTCIYKPNAADELQVTPGEILLHLNRDPNGWVKVRKKDTAEEGWVPMACLSADENEEGSGKPLLSKQMSAPGGVDRPATTPTSRGPSSPTSIPESNLSPELTGLQYRAECPYVSEQEGHLSFDAGEYIVVLETHENGWWRGCYDGCEGWFPGSYVKIVAASPSADESGYAPSLTPPPSVPPPDMFADCRKDLSTVFEEESLDEVDGGTLRGIGSRMPVEGQESNTTVATVHAPGLNRPELPKRFVKPKLVKVRASALKHRTAVERPKMAAPPPPPRPPGPVKLLKPKSKAGKRHTLPDIRDPASIGISDCSPVADKKDEVGIRMSDAADESSSHIPNVVVVPNTAAIEEKEELELPTPGLCDSIILPDEDAMNQYLAKQFDILLESTCSLDELKRRSVALDPSHANTSGEQSPDVSSTAPLIRSANNSKDMKSLLNQGFDSQELSTPEGLQLRAAVDHTPTPYSVYKRHSGSSDHTGSDGDSSLDRRSLPRAPPRRSIPVAAVKPVCQEDSSHYDNLNPHFNKSQTSVSKVPTNDKDLLSKGEESSKNQIDSSHKLPDTFGENEIGKSSDIEKSKDHRKLSDDSDDTYDVILGPVSDLIDEIGKKVDLDGLTTFSADRPSCSSDISCSGSERSSDQVPKKRQSLSRSSSGRSSSSRTFSRSSSGRSSGCQRPTVPPPPPPTSTSSRSSVTASVSQPHISLTDQPKSHTHFGTSASSAESTPQLPRTHLATHDLSNPQSSTPSTPRSSSRGSSPPPLPEAPPPSLLPPSIFDDDDEDLLSSITKYLSPSSPLVDSGQKSPSPPLIDPDSRSTPSPIMNLGPNVFKISMFDDDSPTSNGPAKSSSYNGAGTADLPGIHNGHSSHDKNFPPSSTSYFSPIDSPQEGIPGTALPERNKSKVLGNTSRTTSRVPLSSLSNTAWKSDNPTSSKGGLSLASSNSVTSLPSPTSDEDPFTTSITMRSPSEESIEVRVLTRGKSPPGKAARRSTTSPPLPPKPDYETRKAILSRRSPTKSPREKSPPPIAPKPDLKKLRRKSAPPEPASHWFWGSKSGSMAKSGSSMWVRNAAKRSDGGLGTEGPPQKPPPAKPHRQKMSLGSRSPPIPENSMKRAITDGNLSFDSCSLKRATQSYFGKGEEELSFAENSFIKDLGEVVDRPGWMIGELLDGTTGMYPKSHVCDLSTTHSDEDLDESWA